FQILRSGATMTPIGAGGGDIRHPRYSPDGVRVAFSRRRGGEEHVWILDTRTGAEEQLTFSRGNDTEPAWSPDGGAIYFASDRGRGIFMPAIYRIALPEAR